ncbi:cytochrome c oxidase subunit 6b-2 [Hordeum vulgare]|nr:cytochrome c oxidase subunit 6b-2 [Hordeum vulgare]
MEETAEEQAAAPAAVEFGDTAENGMEEEGASASAAAEEDAAATEAAAAAYSWPELRFDIWPRRRYHFVDQFRSPCSSSVGNFLKGVKWSPDGSSFLTSSDNNSLRMFYLYTRPACFCGVSIEIKTSPADFRFPTTNQTRHCFTRYVEFHGCVGAKGDEAVECDKFAKYYRSLCPAEWVDKWNEQRENGTFAGPL